MVRLVLFFGLIASAGWAQIPERPNLYDSLGNRVGKWVVLYDSAYQNMITHPDSAHYYCLVNLESGKPKGKVECFFISGIKQWDGYLLSLDPDIKHGEATFYYPLGNVNLKLQYKNDVRDGPYEEYYENGQLSMVGQMKNDSTDGPWTIYHPNGNLFAKGSYIANHQNGFWEYYFENGQLKSKGNVYNDTNDGYWEFYHENGQLNSQGTINKGLYQGKWTFFYPSGKVEWETEYVDDLMEGPYRGYHENGQLSQKGNHLQNKKHGFYQFFHDNGQLESEGETVHGLYQGPWTFYYSNGNIASNRIYVDDKENGYFTYYYENGNKKSEGNVTNDQWNGVVTFYHENGQKQSTGSIVHSIYQGEWHTFYEDGTPNSLVTYVNDTTRGYWEFYHPNGQLGEKGLLNGKNIKEGDWEFYYSNGQLKERGPYRNNEGDGYFEHYYANGNLKKKGVFIKGQEDGSWAFYYENGNLKSKGGYELGKRVGFWQYFYENGALSTHGHYVDGNSVGHWKYYYDNGNLKSEGEEFGDRRLGIWKYYYANGALNYTGETRDDKGYGRWVYYDSLGRKYSEGYWDNNLENGPWVWYDSLGRKEKEGSFKDGNSQGKWVYYEKGRKDQVIYWDRGLMLNFRTMEDSAISVAERRDVELLAEIMKAAKKYWRKEFNKGQKGYYQYALLQGETQKHLGEYTKAIEHYREALNLLEQVETDTSWYYAYALNEIGYTYYNANDYKNSVLAFEEGRDLTIRTKGRLSDDYTVLNRWLAYAYFYDGQHYKAFEALEDDLNYKSQQIPDSIEVLSNIRFTIAELLYRNSEGRKAISALQELVNYLETNDREGLWQHSESFRFLGYSYDQIDQRDSAILAYHQAIASYESRQDTIDVSYLYNFYSLADDYYIFNQYDSASLYYDILARKCKEANFFNHELYPKSIISQAKMLFENWHYGEAIKKYEEVLEILLKDFKNNRYDIAAAYQGLALCLEQLDESNLEAIVQNYQKSMGYSYSVDKYSGTYTNTSLNLASLYRSNKKYPESIDQIKSTMAYLESYEMTQTEHYARCNRILGQVEYSRYNYPASEAYFKKALEIYELDMPSGFSYYAWTLSNIADIYEGNENYEEAEKYLLKSLSTIKEYIGEENGDYAGILSQLAYNHRERGNYSNAEIFYKQSLGIKERVFGKNTSSYSNTLMSLGISYKLKDDYDLAISTIKDAISLILSNGTKMSQDYIDCLQHLGDSYNYSGEVKESENAFKEMIQISEELYSDNKESHAYYLREIGKFYESNGKVEKAYHFLIPAMNIIEGIHGKRNRKYAYYSENLAELYYKMERYQEAESIQQNIVEIYRETAGEDSWEFIDSYKDLSNLYQDLGRFVEAEQILLEVNELVEAKYGYYSFSYARALQDLGGLYRWWRKPEQAITTLKESVSVIDSLPDAGPADYFDTYNLLGLSLSDLGKADEADKYLSQIRDEALKLWGPESSSYYTFSNNLAFVYLLKDDFKTSEELFIEGGKRFDHRKVVSDLERVNFEDNLAALYLAWGKLDRAEKYWTSVTETLLKKVNEDFAFMSESEKANFWDAHKPNFEYFNSYALAAAEEKPKAIGQMYDNQLQTKSILLSASTKERRKIINSGDSLLISKYFEYVDLKENLAKYYGYGEEQLREERINLDSLEKEANNYEKLLSINADHLDAEERAKKVRWRDIQRTLKPHEAAVEIIRFRHFHKQVTDSVIYAALILTSETKRSPELVILPNGNDLENKYLQGYRTTIQFQLEDTYSYKNFWESIDKKLRGKTVVYFSPDAVFNQISINTLQRPDGSYILDHYNVQILTSTRDVLLLEKETKKKFDQNIATLFGFPQYDLAHAEIENIVIERAIERNRTLERAIDLKRFGFTELPGTKTETESITQILALNQWDAQLYLGSDALEEILKSVNNPRVLHIATHGFFLDDVGDQEVQLGVSSTQSRKDPLLRSGLLLAGAAQTVKGDFDNRTENGIFTAYEAMNLNLNDTDLVVLSACETGRGEVKSGEGVYGLQRAFQVAGAESLIMSLWKVNDDATQMLMTNFYHNWLSGMAKNKAFEKAQLSVKAKYQHPYYWGAFVMVGG